jgi:nucleotide-binding universal stress UspA family protein
MSTITSILVPTDFSSKSDTAVRYACEIASYTGAKVMFMHVIEQPYDFPSRIEDVLESKKSESAKKLSKLIDGLHSTDDFRHVNMKGSVEVGSPYTMFLNAAKTGKFDMIVVGLGGDHDLKKAIYGSITNNILLESPIPVFAMSKKVDYRQPKHLVFATGLRNQDIKPIKQMKKFSIELGIKLRIVHIVEKKANREEKGKKFQKKLRKELKDDTLQIEYYEDKSFLEGITRLIGGDQHTILVTTRYKRRFVEWLITRSNARVLAQIAAVPLIMIPND